MGRNNGNRSGGNNPQAGVAHQPSDFCRIKEAEMRGIVAAEVKTTEKNFEAAEKMKFVGQGKYQLPLMLEGSPQFAESLQRVNQELENFQTENDVVSIGQFILLQVKDAGGDAPFPGRFHRLRRNVDSLNFKSFLPEEKSIPAPSAADIQKFPGSLTQHVQDNLGALLAAEVGLFQIPGLPVEVELGLL